MSAIVQVLSLITLRLAQAAILGTLAIVSYEVIARYVFNSPTQSSLEVTEYFLVAMGFLSLAAISSAKGHVAVDLLTSQLSIAWQRVCQVLVILITAIFASIVTWFGVDMTWHAYVSQTVSSSLLSFPMWIAYLSIPLGFFALALESIAQLLELPIRESR
jgi:C4-dicarboxylate transporter, DctQ subunit